MISKFSLNDLLKNALRARDNWTILDTNFDISNVGLYYLRIFFMLAKFHGDQRSITMSSINYLNLSFCSLK